MKKNNLLLLFLFWGMTCAFAQQDGQFSQYMFNQMYFNPAFTGADPRYIQMALTHRRQWVGYEATFDDGTAPVTTFGFINAPIPGTKSGLGLQFTNDRIAAMSGTELLLSYAYHLPVKNGSLSLGLSAGMNNQAIDFSLYRANDPEDFLQFGNRSQMKPDIGAGICLKKTRYYVGVGTRHLAQPKFDFNTGSVWVSRRMHFNLMGGANFDLSPAIALSPSAIVKTDMNSLSYEGSLLSTFHQKFYAGVSLRASNALDDAILLLGINLLKDNSLRVGYALDYVISGVAAKTSTSHEVTIGYRFLAPTPLKKPIIRTPRFRY